MKDNKRAIADLDRTIELNPNHAVAYSSRGFAKSAIKDYKGAIADFDKVIELNPENADQYRQLMKTVKEKLYSL